MSNRQVAARPFIKIAVTLFFAAAFASVLLIFFGQQWFRPWFAVNGRDATDDEVVSALFHFVFTAASGIVVCFTFLTSAKHWQRTAGQNTYEFQGWFVVTLVMTLCVIMFVCAVDAVLAEYPPLNGTDQSAPIRPPEIGERPGDPPKRRKKTLSEHVQYNNTFMAIVLFFLLTTQYFTLPSQVEEAGKSVDLMEETVHT